jgi:hypothetical protein
LRPERRTRQTWPAALCLCALACFSCSPPEEVVYDDTYQPDCDVEDPEEDIVHECPSGVYECPADQACLGGICGDTCSSAYQCYPLEGCRGADNSCGTCLYDEDCRTGEGCVEGVCLQDPPPQWELLLTADDWAALEADVGADDNYVECTLLADGIAYDQDVRVRLRGGSTRSLPKRSFRIEFLEDADHPGYQRKINLRAEYNDPSALRTFLGFETMRRSSTVPTPRVRYVDLYLRTDAGQEAYLDDNFYGLFVEIERLGGAFLDANGRDRELAMFEAKWVDPHGTLTPTDDLEDYYIQETGDYDGYDDLEVLVDDALAADWESFMADEWNTAGESLELIRTEGYLGYLATMAALQCHDHVTNNFYFSYQYLGVEEPGWEFYATDLDLTFGCLWDSANHDPLCHHYSYDGWWLNGLFDWDDDVDLGADEYWGNLATHSVLSHEPTVLDYERQLCDLVDSDWWTDRMPEVVHALQTNLADSQARDWERWAVHKEADFDFDYVASQDEVLLFMEDRRDYLRGNLGCP